MRYQAEPGTEVAGVTPLGEVHDPIIFDEEGFVEVTREALEQIYGQTIAHALAAGTIRPATTKPPRRS